ncbi:MAG TPA: (2,3-dihydroxybenzoyl)adenylate synthase [Nocardioidaceae bacterium]|nr:(2,3-dihydroxybenzoyl)adenylate synthase [Nocardioidaceae bacterium]
MPTPIGAGTVPWPDDLAETYVAKGYWRGRSLGEHLWSVADRRPDAIALIDGEVRMTYADLTARADATATALHGLGITAGHRLVNQLPNGWEFVVLTLACLRAGVVPVMALPAHRENELDYLIAHAEASAIAVPDTLRGFDHQAMARQLAASAPGLEHVLVAGDSVGPGAISLRDLCRVAHEPATARKRWDAEPPAARDVAVFLLSGGTTGLPKLIARTHDDYEYNARGSAEVCGFDEDTVYLVSLPAGHNFPLACPGILGTFLVGGRVVMLPSPEPGQALRAIAEEGVTATAVVPAVAQRWMDHRRESPGEHDLGSLRLLQVGGARLADELAVQVRPVLGARLQQVFGMAEGLLNFTRLDDPDDVVCRTQGRPMCPDDEVLVVDPAGDPVRDGEPGSLLTRGPYTPRGYFRAEEHNARSFTADGWYRSGDIVRRRADGNLVVEGRDKDMINRGGEKISAEEVENFAYQVPGVMQAAAVAMPDRVLGERVCLYVVSRTGTDVDLEAVRSVMQAAGVARYKWPERLENVDALATTKVGKIDKRSLREDITAKTAAERGTG